MAREVHWEGHNGNLRCNTEGRCYVKVSSKEEFRLLTPSDIAGIPFKLFSVDKEIKLRVLSKALEKRILKDELIKSQLNHRYRFILNWLKKEKNKGKSNDELKAGLKEHLELVEGVNSQ